MTDPNSRQVAGDHYRKLEYQHWDWVVDDNLPYLLGCATKYVARWRDKNGAQDLEKAVHYLDKSLARGLHIPRFSAPHAATFCAQLDPEDAAIIGLIVTNRFQDAISNIDGLIRSHTPAQ